MSSQGVELAQLCLPAETFNAKIARDLVSAVAGAAGVEDDTAYIAKPATSELVTEGLAEGGYGPIVVDDITDECGYHFTDLGKAVWFSLKATWALRPAA